MFKNLLAIFGIKSIESFAKTKLGKIAIFFVIISSTVYEGCVKILNEKDFTKQQLNDGIDVFVSASLKIIGVVFLVFLLVFFCVFIIKKFKVDLKNDKKNK